MVVEQLHSIQDDPSDLVVESGPVEYSAVDQEEEYEEEEHASAAQLMGNTCMYKVTIIIILIVSPHTKT